MKEDGSTRISYFVSANGEKDREIIIKKEKEIFVFISFFLFIVFFHKTIPYNVPYSQRNVSKVKEKWGSELDVKKL